ncbi:MAG: hypothetical protein ABSC41_00800 [Acidimicrobiales bacterium]|jgi:hypothetical protein
MSEGIGPEQLASAGGRRQRRRWLPFWVIQATEIVVALVFADISVHVANGGLLVGGAIALIGLAVTAQGPLGLFRICGQRLHVVLAMALSAVIALAPFVPALRPDIEGIIVVEFGAVGLFRVATLTMTGQEHRAIRRGASDGSPVIDTTATVIGEGGGGGGMGGGVATGSGAATGSGTATGTNGGRPTASPTTSGAAARWAGRASGAAVASGKQVVTNYRPEAEIQVKRTIRGIGKLAGRVSSRLIPPDDSTR